MPKTTREVVLKTLPYIQGRTLDLGAGTAKYKGMIKPKTSDYVTYDMIPGPAIDVVGDILDLDLPDVSFDTVISTQVLEHVEKPWVMVSQIRRILKPGGICIISAPFLVPYHADPHDYFRYTKEGLKSLLRNEGFEILECESYGKWWMVQSESIHFQYFNPYDQRSLGRIKKLLFRLIQKSCYALDKFSKSSIVYPNVYVVARKKD